MGTLIQDWLRFLENTQPALGIPLLLIGLTLMLMGWSFYRAAVPFIFILVGLTIGHLVWPGAVMSWIGGGVAGIILAIVGYLTMKYSVSLLAGICGSFVLVGYLSTMSSLHLPDVAQWGLAGFGFVASAAMSFIMFREMVIIITALVGSFFLVSGMNAILPQTTPQLYITVNSFLKDYPALFTPFLVGGPTIIGTLVQLANANRSDATAG